MFMNKLILFRKMGVEIRW